MADIADSYIKRPIPVLWAGNARRDNDLPWKFYIQGMARTARGALNIAARIGGRNPQRKALLVRLTFDPKNPLIWEIENG